VAVEVQRIWQRLKDLQDIIAILGWTSCRKRQAAGRPARAGYSVSSHSRLRGVAIHGARREYVKLEDTIASFGASCPGSSTSCRNRRFYMQGGIEDVVAQAKKMASA